MTSSLDLYTNTIEDYIVELKDHIKLVHANKSSPILDDMHIIYNNINDNMLPIQLINKALVHSSNKHSSNKHTIYWNNYCIDQQKQCELVKQTLPYMIPFVLNNLE